MIKDCSTCDNFDIETVYGVCCKYGVLSDVKEDCKDWESIANKNIEDKDRLLNEKYKCD